MKKLQMVEMKVDSASQKGARPPTRAPRMALRITITGAGYDTGKHAQDHRNAVFGLQPEFHRQAGHKLPGTGAQTGDTEPDSRDIGIK